MTTPGAYEAVFIHSSSVVSSPAYGVLLVTVLAATWLLTRLARR